MPQDTIWQLAKKIIPLFIPIFLARIGMFTMSMVDAFMLGNSNKAVELAYQSIGDMPIVLILLGIGGLIQGVLYIASEEYGKKQYAKCGTAFFQSLQQALWLGLIALPVIIFAKDFLSFFNYTQECIDISSQIMQISAIGIPFAAIFMVCQLFLQGIKKAWTSTNFMIIANLMNFFLDWILIEGKFGFPPMGGVGVALSTTIVRAFLGLGMLFYILYHSSFKLFIQNKITEKFSINKLQRKLGFAATANMLCTEISFAFCIFFISSISIVSVAAYTLSFRTIYICTLISTSIGVAGSIIVGAYIGKNKHSEVKKVIISSLFCNLFITGIISILFFVFANEIAQFLTTDIAIQTQTIAFLKPMCLIFIFFGIYCLLIIGLRSLYDMLIPSIIVFVSYPITIPLACYIFSPTLGVLSVIYAIIIGTFLSSSGLFIRFLYLNRFFTKTC